MKKVDLWCTCQHRGGLKEALATEQFIDEEIAAFFVKSGFYQFYGYDDRIGAIRFIIKDMVKYSNFPTWLHCYDEEVLYNYGCKKRKN